MKKAFTLMELAFVIVIIGILTAVIIPRTSSSRVHEYAAQLTSAIKHTQHLSMVDDAFSSDPNWHRNRWKITINDSNYSVQSNGTFAQDPLSKTDLNNVELKGATMTLSGGCEDKSIISFGHLGRPYIGEISALTKILVTGTTTKPFNDGQLLLSNCVITLTDGSTTATINVTPETGYTYFTVQ